MEKKLLFGFFGFLLLLSFLASAHKVEGVLGHEQEHGAEPTDYLPVDPLFIVLNVFSLIVVLAAISIIFQKWMSEGAKKFFFLVISLSIVLTTFYVGASTVYLNVISESGGPVHWHADFEIWACGKQITNLKKAEFPSNKVGSSTFHHHDDFRIHVEGLVIKKEDVSLENFFGVIGGKFSGDSMAVELEDGSIITISNGDLCSDDKPGKWRLYIKNNDTLKFEENFELQNYVIKPYFEVPPGDFLRLVFDSKEGSPNGS